MKQCEVFRSLQRNEVKYLVIDGIASILYGVPNATFDIDILIEATDENAEKLLSDRISLQTAR